VLAGLAAWVGATTQHADVGLGSLLEAGLNVVPPAVFVLGIGALAFGLWPRGAVGVVYGLVVWSFVVETIAAVFDSNHWLRDTSPLLHITPVPAADPHWTAAACSSGSACSPPRRASWRSAVVTWSALEEWGLRRLRSVYCPPACCRSVGIGFGRRVDVEVIVQSTVRCLTSTASWRRRRSTRP
jgi:hypothetical protein